MHRHGIVCVAVLAAFSSGPIVAAAQTARVMGRAHALGDSTRAVPNAEVTLLPLVRTTQSDSSGAFQFAAVADGSYRLRVRRLGFAVAEIGVEVAGQHDVTVQVPLRASPQALAEITINGQRVMFPARYADAYARVARGSGDYFTSETMEKMHALDMKSLLQTLPGVLVNDRGITFMRCEGNPFAVPPKGSSAMLDGSGPPPRGGGPQAAHVQVYINGVRVTGYSSGGLDDVQHALRDIRPTSLQLVEVYRGVSRIPGEYLDDACAVILIWTK